MRVPSLSTVILPGLLAVLLFGVANSPSEARARSRRSPSPPAIPLTIHQQRAQLQQQQNRLWPLCKRYLDSGSIGISESGTLLLITEVDTRVKPLLSKFNRLETQLQLLSRMLLTQELFLTPRSDYQEQSLLASLSVEQQHRLANYLFDLKIAHMLVTVLYHEARGEWVITAPHSRPVNMPMTGLSEAQRQLVKHLAFSITKTNPPYDPYRMFLASSLGQFLVTGGTQFIPGYRIVVPMGYTRSTP